MNLLYILPVAVIIESAFSDNLNELGKGAVDAEVTNEPETVSSTSPTAGPEPWEHPLSDVVPAHHLVPIRYTHSVTRLIKTLSDGFNPQILQKVGNPIEKRRKPVTLIGMRRHGMFPHQSVDPTGEDSGRESDVAELMSPFNDIGHFWDE